MTPAERSLVILVAIMILYITELIPLAVTAVGSCAAAVLFGVVPVLHSGYGYIKGKRGGSH